MSVKRFKASPLHKYLARFANQKFLDQGHNLSRFDINQEFIRPTGGESAPTRRPTPVPPVDPGVLASPPPATPGTIDLDAPTTPQPVQDASRLERLASAGAGRRIVNREARQSIRAARQAGDLPAVGALQHQRAAARNIIRQERALTQEALDKTSRRRRKKGLI